MNRKIRPVQFAVGNEKRRNMTPQQRLSVTKRQANPMKPDLVVHSESSSQGDKVTTIGAVEIAPSVNATAVIHAYQDNLFGELVEMPSLVDALVSQMKQIKAGDI